MADEVIVGASDTCHHAAIGKNRSRVQASQITPNW
jgi:hypothetical protein